jgi:hypothetical protein
MRTFFYIVSVAAGTYALGACGLKIAKTFYEHGIGFGPEPQTSLCYLGAAVGLGLIVAPFRHSFRAKID